MKKRIKSITMAFLVAVILCTTVFAAPIWKNVNIAYNNLKVNIDGVETILTDLEGRAIEPFIYDGVAYVPLSPLSRALGKNAQYDGAAMTIFITTPEVPRPPAPKLTYFFDVLTAFEKANGGYGVEVRENQSFKMLGDDYANGWLFNASSYYVGSGHGGTASALYNLRGQYKTIKGILGHIDGTTRDGTGTLNIYLDNVLYKTYPMSSTMLPTEIVLDVTRINIMKVEYILEGSYKDAPKYGLGNVTIE